MNGTTPRRILAPLLAVLCGSLASCTITFDGHGDQFSARDRGRVFLAETTEEDWTQVRYRLVRTGNDGAAIHREETRSVELPYFGVKGRSVDASIAAERALTPWRGILVTSVTPGTASEDAGIVSDDVIVSVGGAELGSYEQFVELAGSFAPGAPTELVVSSVTADGDGRAERVIDFVVGSREVDENEITRVPLRGEALPLKRAGVDLATLPEDLARAIHGVDDTRVMVTGIWTGGPAYDEGLRGGDIVERVNGLEVRTAEEVSAIIDAGVDRLDFEVTGLLGDHEASVRLIKDVESTSNFGIPILVSHSSRVGRSRTSVLDFIFQFGWNHRTRAVASETREPRSSTYLSILPFGMFEFTRKPGYSKNRIFWFITWGGA